MAEEVKERARKFIEEVKPIADKAGATGALLPLITNSKRAVESSDKCDPIGITYSLEGIGEAFKDIEQILRKAERENRITLSERFDLEWSLKSFLDFVKHKVMTNLGKACKTRI